MVDESESPQNGEEKTQENTETQVRYCIDIQEAMVDFKIWQKSIKCYDTTECPSHLSLQKQVDSSFAI